MEARRKMKATLEEGIERELSQNRDLAQKYRLVFQVWFCLSCSPFHLHPNRGRHCGCWSAQWFDRPNFYSDPSCRNHHYYWTTTRSDFKTSFLFTLRLIPTGSPQQMVVCTVIRSSFNAECPSCRNPSTFFLAWDRYWTLLPEAWGFGAPTWIQTRLPCIEYERW